ncbi:phospholipase A2 inhibitor and Ly6/PLAUR domain-containing protein-like [Archocentrus centrarchus]|uniref:phospholipase A2 inhibitor and Ly6/PLAUR domain-containing protein-like n=1 Tax=Archocentrus centrarchus TaxID=63155 RepID=UPI0011E9C92C|nr:phospholipase A2 inhibitor and Ly6/PLAUR domain-containing protein-like [Archocentrus centrarchus]
MKPIMLLILLWAVSSTAGALQCQICTDQMCSSTAPNNCSSETMCVTTTILAYSSGVQARQIYKACASSSLCPRMGTQTFSVDLGFQSALASAMCCNTDNCNSETLPDPAPQSGNGLLCNVCDPSTSQCTSTLQCEGVENRCFQSTSESLCCILYQSSSLICFGCDFFTFSAKCWYRNEWTKLCSTYNNYNSYPNHNNRDSNNNHRTPSDK